MKLDIHKRSTCPMSSWLDLFGDKWTLLILRDMAFFNKKHFKQFINSEEKISSNILSARLKRLEEIDMIVKTPNPVNKLLVDYTLTPRALTLAPIFKEVALWSKEHITDVREIEFPEAL